MGVSKRTDLFTLTWVLLSLFANAAAAAGVKSIFLFKDVLQSNTTALKTSGFDTLLIFRIGLLGNGDLVYYSTGDAGEAVDAPVVTNGSYVGGTALAEKVKSFKTGTTNINRVEISLVSHDTTFQIIRDLINADGTGSDTKLYKNFEVLKAEWDLDAFNNDDEGVYDVASTVSFAQMLGKMGYQYSIAPYTNSGFWANVRTQVESANPGLFDRVYLQVYDGGAGNNPGTWQTTLGMKVIPLVWVVNDAKPSQGTTATQAQQRFASWFSQYVVAGGGYWNDYDIEKMGSSYTDYGAALTSVF
ncbi:coagulation factor 5/8 type domain-containing protein [Colletotrichum abscissum]|uniref:Coagulation factor 5/8 type domain-containing protein n=2 Tax=Colletotrichum acutatum species complex TaxID=2707335 RepID=A0A9Q0B994_9PEZI|nr:coagulation factor 5/8 type domain-containing protein [Colletotrichum tamarilloi]XP_060403103.1 coagulation factor 5/8 type domain-containing protein [Colletotrichum abscissum]KAI3558484.1 coagulation factor 5/8 type domain-containing protein [Colletotrichum abscissum]KAK1492534.1 coagulation factor 5/8 type domain-containing protein [Colletotrichum tamarilloi]KAK1511615.1 coagulation factor 5/8 type domain-containing protein [Colletotrichum abscissum]